MMASEGNGSAIFANGVVVITGIGICFDELGGFIHINIQINMIIPDEIPTPVLKVSVS
jgi:hypothetical protein